jgi:hypothetical protein
MNKIYSLSSSPVNAQRGGVKRQAQVVGSYAPTFSEDGFLVNGNLFTKSWSYSQQVLSDAKAILK